MQLFRFSYKNQAFIKVIIGFKRHFIIFVFGKVHDSATGLRRSSHFYVLKEKIIYCNIGWRIYFKSVIFASAKCLCV
ncbi:hypothetical protein M2325_000733 [Methanococcus voltae PS]|uniref:Uncharacterized protein n=1 Tax=Methanococcus voltae PS TaxID=523842 RepID=A0ABT2EYJ4_METVO|nr:hypothetical protein [Methanococcus voltae]MCS3922048.1 hypothetical protein [Methanococcus voltae PS]